MTGASFTEHIVPRIVGNEVICTRMLKLMATELSRVNNSFSSPCSLFLFLLLVLSHKPSFKKIKIQKANRNSFYYNLFNKYLCVSAIG